ncbi:MAG TPA: FAD binding domain-containing protein [Alphaproteobacteria bacterium]|nr:FAD binding domain-containing protein [Alphaproteobacteria bacterium]
MSGVALARARSLEEALELLAADPEARPLAGGASLVAMMNAGLVAPTTLVSLRDVEALRGIRPREDGTVRIGAMTRHCESAAAAELSGTLATLRAAARRIANPVVRNMGTIGGSIALSDPGADYPPALVALDAEIEIASLTGARRVPARAFFVDWYATALEPGELVTAIHLPAPRPGIGIYRKLARVAGDFATVSVALSAGEDGRVSVAIGGSGPAPVVSDEANELLSETLDDPRAVARAGESLAARSDPVDDVRASAAYRRRVIPRLLAEVARAARLQGAAA